MMLDRDIVAVSLGIDMNKLVRLMRHGSKKMVRYTGITSRGWKRMHGRFWRTLEGTSSEQRQRCLSICCNILLAEMWSFLFHISD